MYGNGQMIGMIATITALAQVTIRKDLQQVLTVFFGAVAGTTALATAVLPFAFPAAQRTRATLWASAQYLFHSSKEKPFHVWHIC